MRITKWIAISLIALTFSCLGASRVSAGDDHGTKVRWDIIQIVGSGTTFTALPGGVSTSAVNPEPAQGTGDGSNITLTGSGTFRLNDGHDVTGGGTWETATSGGTETGAGTYRVTELVHFEFAPGSFAETGLIDGFGNPADASAGIAVLKVDYNDGTKGIVVVICALAGSPTSILEGTTATKGYVDYADVSVPNPSVGNTLFHILKE